ncbi:50S ribosomal protein L17 [Desulfobulbus sp.]|uniref:50S ribosomal protein L17 n=1 Tax=Desulfobulbus sp. TaxID=895 RepID=UPI0027BA467E|nr:50S ribosomal protein L17 [Desulfobulbus sp.]
MRHRKAGRKLGRNASHRDAMFRNMVTSLLDQERIVTTVPKAKEARRVAEQMITLGKRGDLHARRQAMAYIRSKSIVAKLFDQLSGQYSERHGGYTRIIRTGTRLGDAAPMAILELVDYQEQVEEVKGAQEQ